MKHLTLLTLLLLAASFGWGNPSQDDDGEVDVAVYSPPVPFEKANPRYPRKALSRGVEGWVTMHYMVDPTGKTYDIEIVDSNGDRSLENAAVRAAEKYRYDPAKFQGQPIDAGASTRINFAIRDQKFLAKKFAKLFTKFQSAAKENSQGEMKLLLSKLDDLEITTLYESAMTQLMKAAYAMSIDDSEALRQAYGKTLSLNKDHNFFTEAQTNSFMLALMQAEVATGHIRAALDTWSQLDLVLTDEQLRSKLLAQTAELQSLLAGNGATSVNGKITVGYSFAYKLAKPTFALSKVVGRLAEVKLFCEKGRVAFPATEDVVYRVEKDLGVCTLILVGDPKTTFEIIDGA
tara:strand:- start:175 stop:1215 length:1041 start_codon:yes stop_codon:yes gene_type:complete